MLLLFQLTPLFSDLDYLEEQHIILAVKTEDGMESYGEWVRERRGRSGGGIVIEKLKTKKFTKRKIR